MLAQTPLSLEDATRRAAAQNRIVQQAQSGVALKKDEAAAARTKRWPVLSTTLQAGPILNRAEVTFPRGSLGDYPATGPIPGKDMAVAIPRRLGGYTINQASLPLTQQLRIGAAIQSADLDSELARTQADRTEREVTAQVRNLYFQLTALEGARRAASSQLEVATEIERLAEEGVKQGTVLPAEQAEAAARLARVRADVANLETDIADGYEQLNVVLGEPLGNRYGLAMETPSAALTLDEARQKALAARPEVKEARLRAEQAGVAVRAKRLEWIPDVSLQLTHFSFVNASNLAPNQLATAALALQWEPWDWGRKNHETAAAREREKQARLAVEQTEQQVQFEAGRAWREWDRAQRNLAAARLAVTSSAEGLRIVRQRYAQQAALLRNVLEAQTVWESAGQQEARAVAAVGTAWANLQLAVGEGL